jgi:hypothetical protein
MLTTPIPRRTEKSPMSTLTAAQQDTDKVLKRLIGASPQTMAQLGCSRHRILTMLAAKLVKRAGTIKNDAGVGRKAVAYDLTAKGRKRAEKL